MTLPTFGTSSNDTMTGTSGADTLYGLAGNDTINGGAGADLMGGGSGDDTYTVDNVGDILIEDPNEGWDTVVVDVNNYVLGAHVESAYITSAAGWTLTGNAQGNTLQGHNGNEWLFGLGGNDALYGHGQRHAGWRERQ